MNVLVTGATGFVGSGLVPRLLAAGHQVRCLVRDRDGLPAGIADSVEVVTGDVASSQAVLRAADGCEVAVYLVHGMGEGIRGLVEREIALARAFADGVELSGVRRVVYLGGLIVGEEVIDLSDHLYARMQAGVTLRQGPVPVTELQAGIVIGAGSASFELMRAAARAPLVPDAPATRSRCQPIAIDDLLVWLATSLDADELEGRIAQIGGPDVLTYAEMVAAVRDELGLPPAARVPLPYLAPESGATLGALAAGVDPALAFSLLASSRGDAVVTDPWALALGPSPTPFRTAVHAALAHP